MCMKPVVFSLKIKLKKRRFGGLGVSSTFQICGVRQLSHIQRVRCTAKVNYYYYLALIHPQC